MKRWLTLAMLLLMAGSAAAHTPVQGVWEYDVHLFTKTSVSGAVPTVTVEVPDLHNNTVLDRESLLLVHVVYSIFRSDTGLNETYRVSWNGTVLEDCSWDVESTTGETLEDPGAKSHLGATIACLIQPSVNPGTHTVKIETDGLGVTEITTTSAILQQRETIEQVDNVNEILETLEMFAPIIAMVLIFIWAEITRHWMVYLLAAVAGITATISVWEEIAEIRLLVVTGTIIIILFGILDLFSRESGFGDRIEN